MGNGMNKVLPGVYIGNYHDSKDYSQIRSHSITHILSVHDSAKKIFPDKFYLCVPASDSPDQNLHQYFSLCNDFIHAARLRDGNILIHCLAGMSRSVTIAVAYIMSVTTLDAKDALKVVRVGRSLANPNSGFIKQLNEFESSSKLVEERKRLKERFPSLALVELDRKYCFHALQSYERLIKSKRLCAASCSRGEICPTGVCNRHTKIKVGRKSSIDIKSKPSSSRSSSLHTKLQRRPKSGPAVLMSCKSEPCSRASSTTDLSCSTLIMEVSGKSCASHSAPVTPYQSPQRKGVVAQQRKYTSRLEKEFTDCSCIYEINELGSNNST